MLTSPPSDYGGAWAANLLQADEAVESFNEFCFDAGPKCPFYRNDSSPEAIKSRVDAILADLTEDPIGVSDPNFVSYPVVINHMDVRIMFMLAVYDAIVSFPSLSLILSDLEQRNGSLLAASLEKGVMPLAECDDASPEYSSVNPKLVVACNDMNGNYNISTMEQWYEYTELLQDYSSYFGQVWSMVITLNCRNLQVAPPKSQVWHGM